MSSSPLCSLLDTQNIVSGDVKNCMCSNCSTKFDKIYTKVNDKMSSSTNNKAMVMELLNDPEIKSFTECAAGCSGVQNVYNAIVCAVNKYNSLPSNCKSSDISSMSPQCIKTFLTSTDSCFAPTSNNSSNNSNSGNSSGNSNSDSGIWSTSFIVVFVLLVLAIAVIAVVSVLLHKAKKSSN